VWDLDYQDFRGAQSVVFSVCYSSIQGCLEFGNRFAMSYCEYQALPKGRKFVAET
jgi:hypothetical protein